MVHPILTVSLGLAMVLSVVLSGSALAAPTAQDLFTDTTVLCEAFVTDGYVPVSTSLAAYQVYSTGVGHDDHAGYVYWGNASSSTVGTFGIARVKLALTDPTGELADYYLVNIYTGGTIFRYPDSTPLTMVPGTGSQHHMSSRIGWGYSTPELGTYYQVGDWGYQEAGPLNFYEDINMTLDSRPWSLEEIQAMYVEIDLRFDSEAVAQVYGSGGAIRQILTYVYLWVEPAEYTPPPESTPTPGSFILRPDGDLASWAWSSTEATRTAAVNETYYHGDGDVSFINSTKPTAYTEFSLTDPEPWLEDEGRLYQCYPWVIAKTAEPIDSDEAQLWLGMDRSITHEPPNIEGIQGGWYNHSVGAMLVGEGPYLNWTYADLVSAKIYITSLISNISITQIAVLCILVATPVIEDPVGDIAEWLGIGGGFFTIFGVIGFLGLFATPIVTILAVRSGEVEPLRAAASALVLGIVFLCCFMVGLIGF